MRRGTLPIPALLLAVLAACAGSADKAEGTASSATAQPACTPLETRAPNAPDQKPAFPGQTRACGITASNVAFDVTVVARGLAHPWSVEPMPDGSMLVTERPGRMRMISATGDVGEPIAGVPAVDAGGQGGLLDVALSPSFGTDRAVYWSFSEPRGSGTNATSVARGTLSADGRRMEGARVIFQSLPAYDGRAHFGSRLAFGPDGKLYITLGDRSSREMRRYAQQLDSHLGKTVRINPDGSVPPDNPFVGQPGALPEIWSLGHRNIQSAAFDATGDYWTVEHGTRGGDELNLVRSRANYGWPLVTYGIEYSGSPIANSVTEREGFVQPVYYWDPVIAPSGAQFYTGSQFPAWQGSLFIGSLKDRRLVRLTLADEKVTGEEHLLTDRGQRIRDVRQGPDGALYIVTDEENGEVWRITARR